MTVEELFQMLQDVANDIHRIAENLEELNTKVDQLTRHERDILVTVIAPQ